MRWDWRRRDHLATFAGVHIGFRQRGPAGGHTLFEMARTSEDSRLLEEVECLLNEGGMVLEDAACPASGKMLICAFGSLRTSSNELSDGTITSLSPFATRTGC